MLSIINLNLKDITGEEIFYASLSIVIPKLTGELDDYWRNPECEEEEAANVWEYGYKANIWESSDENPLCLLVEAVKKAQNVPDSFFYYMDRPQNKLGWTGWDIIGKNQLAPARNSVRLNL